jgi:hypothetical protein
VPKSKIVTALLDESISGESGAFPTNLTGGLKGRGHPLGATGMIQVVENHQMLLARRFKAGLSHSIGGPINNNVVILLERSESFNARDPVSFKPWGMPALGHLKPADVTLGRITGEQGVEGSFVTSTTRFDHSSGAPLNTILLLSCRTEAGRFSYLLGVGGEHYNAICHLKKGDRIFLEKSGGTFTVNSIPAKRLYQRTLDGLVEMAGTGWRKLAGNGKTAKIFSE